LKQASGKTGKSSLTIRGLPTRIPDFAPSPVRDTGNFPTASRNQNCRTPGFAASSWRGTEVTEKVVWHVMEEYAGRLGIPKLAPHDLRRSCARFCHDSGGELEQIQFILGHVSVQTAEKYLEYKQRLRGAVNDRIGIEPGL